MKKTAFAILAAMFAAISASAGADDRDRAMMTAVLRMDVADRVVMEAAKLDSSEEVSSAAAAYRENVLGGIRESLMPHFSSAEEAQKGLAEFVNAVQKSPGDYGALREGVMKGVLQRDIEAAGVFLGGVQTWLNLKKKGEGVPPLAAWLGRDAKAAPAGAAGPKPKKKRRRNSLRDAEAPAGTFVEAPDDGGSVLGTFGTARNERRQKALKDAESGMAQVMEERRIADEEYNAKKQAAAVAEAAAMQAQAQKLAAAEQEAVEQDQNSWKTRIKGIVSSAAGAAGSAFLGGVGSRVGEAAAQAVFKDIIR